MVVFELDPSGLTVSIKDLSGNEYLPSFSVIKGTEADGSVAASADQVLIQ